MLTEKVPHVSVSRQSFKGQTEKENTITYGREAWGRKERAQKGRRRWKEKKEREREREKVGQFIHVFAAQTVDNETEVDGRPTALLMEQLK